MFYYFQDKHELLEGNPEFKEPNYMFNSYEMELYSEKSLEKTRFQNFLASPFVFSTFLS